MAGRNGAGAPDLSRFIARARRHAPALAAALIVNMVLVSLVAFTTRTRTGVETPPIDVVLVGPPVMPQSRKPEPVQPVSQPARPRLATPRPEAPAPDVPPLPLAPAAAAPGPAPSAGKPFWGDLDRAVVPNIRQNRDCLNGALDRLPASQRETCERRWARFKPQGGTDKPLYPLKDPGGEWGRQAKRQEDRRKPLTQAPVHDCHTDKAMNNLASGCTD